VTTPHPPLSAESPENPSPVSSGSQIAANPDGNALSVEELESGYAGGPNVLRGVTFRVSPGELVVVLGRNGAGKTTLLRTVSGLLACRGGDIRLGQTSLRGVRPHKVARLGVAHVPEGRRVIPGMSVTDNLKLGAFHSSGRHTLDALQSEVLEYFPSLRRQLTVRAGTLSGGQQQMLAIARALMSRPRLLLLDEPLTGLAPVIQDDVMSTLDGLRESDRTILLIEQNAQRSLAIADRGVVLAEGRVVLEGAAAMLAVDPRVQEGYLGIRPEDKARDELKENNDTAQ